MRFSCTRIAIVLVTICCLAPIALAMDGVPGPGSGGSGPPPPPPANNSSAAPGAGAHSHIFSSVWRVYTTAAGFCAAGGLLLRAAVVAHQQHRELTSAEALDTVIGCFFPPALLAQALRGQNNAHHH